MSYKVKIVVAILNLMCLFATLAFPNNTTSFAILITIISVASWAFTTYESSTLGKIGQGIYVTMVSVCAAICFLVGITTKVGKADIEGKLISETANSFDHYVLIISEESFVYAGSYLHYSHFAVGVIAIVTTFMLIEILATAVRKKPNELGSVEKDSHATFCSIADLIDREIGHIR